MDFIPRNNNGVLLPIYIQDMSSNVGAGLTGLTPNTVGLSCYYHRDIDVSPTNIPLAALTIGTYTASGFGEINSLVAPGDYQLGIPPIVSSGSKSYSTITLYGAPNMLPVKLKLMLVDAPMGYVATSGISRNSFSTMTELNSPPTFPANQADMVNWMFMRSINKTITTSNPDGSGGGDVLYKSDGITTVGSGVYSDNGSAFTRNRYQ